MFGIGLDYLGLQDEGQGKLVSEHKQNTKPNHLSIEQNNKWFHPPLSMTKFSLDAVMDRAHLLEITLKTIFTMTNSQSSVVVYHLGCIYI